MLRRLLLFALLVGVSLPSTAAPFPKRMTLVAYGRTVAYSEGDEALARAFLMHLSLLQDANPDNARLNLEAASALGDMGRNKETYLAAAARYLALEKPSSQMSAAYDRMTQAGRLFLNLQASKPILRYQLWRREELRNRLLSGEALAYFSLAGEQVSFDFESLSPSEMAGLAWPVVVKPEDPQELEALAERKAQDAEGMLNGILRSASSLAGDKSTPFVILSAVVGQALVQEYLPSDERGWFCEGLSRYLAWKIVRESQGAEKARQVFDLDAELQPYSDLAATIALSYWPLDEHAPGVAKVDARTREALPLFATRVIAGLAEKRGDDFIPKLLKELARTPYRRRSLETVYRDYRRLTGDDLRREFPELSR